MSLSKSRINDYVTDLFTSAGVVLKPTSGGFRIIVEGKTIGTGPTVAHAVNSAFSSFPEDAGHVAQALYFGAALSFGPKELFEASDVLWEDDDEDDDEDEEEDDEDEDSSDSEESGTIHFTEPE